MGMDMDMDMVTMDTMARGLLKPSLDMVVMVMDMAMDILATDMVVMDTTDIMARGLLMLSQAMDIMAMDMVMDMDMDMAMAMDTTAKHFCCSFLEFSTHKIGPYRSIKKTHNLSYGNKF